MATRLVGDELDLNLSPLTAGFIIIVLVVVRSGGALALDATVVWRRWIPIANCMRIVEYRRRCLFVLICDVGHYDKLSQV